MSEMERLLEGPLLSSWGAGVSEDDQGRVRGRGGSSTLQGSGLDQEDPL